MSTKASIPVPILTDRRVSFRELRVVAAISSLINKKSGACSESRTVIAEVARVSDTNVSLATSNLVGYGWLSKDNSTRPTSYTINWDNAPSVSESDTLNAADSVSRSDTLNRNKVSESDTLNRANSVSRSDTLSPDKVSDSDTLTDSVSRSDTLSPDKVSDSDTLKNPPVKNIYINKYIYKSDQISDADKSLVRTFIEILQSYGMPHHFLKDQSDFETLKRWAGQQVTADLLTFACEKAVSCDGTIGPRYLDKVLSTLIDNEDCDAEPDKSYATSGLLGFQG